MGHAFTVYWRNETWDREAVNTTGQPLVHTAGNEFSRRGVQPGDRIFIVTNRSGMMYVAGAMTVDSIVDRATAEKRLGSDLWEADEHVLGRDGTILNFDRAVSSEVAADLRFGDDEPLVMDENGLIDQQTLRGVRRLRPDSAAILEGIVQSAEPQTVLKLVASPAEIRGNLRHFTAYAPSYPDRAQKLLRQTSYWVYDASTGDFGPGKFVGYSDMSFARYEDGRAGNTTGIRFDGYTSRQAIADALQSEFVENAALTQKCMVWGERLLGAGAFGGADQTKWKFVKLPPEQVSPLEVGHAYTKNDLYRLLQVPAEKQRGQWDTGYARYDGQYFIFCGIGTPGRTGHDYGNRWIGDRLEWKAKAGTRVDHQSVRQLLDGSHVVHVFTRTDDRAPFTYQGVASPDEVLNTTPVTVLWRFESRASSPDPAEIKEPSRFAEGALQQVTVNAYERNPAARAACIAHYGPTCQVCSMNFEAVYGEIGVGFMHVHHVKPLSGIGREYEVDPIEDLIPVCPNCHAMLHRYEPPLSAARLRAIIAPRRLRLE